MELRGTNINDVKLLIPTRHNDERGFLSEVYSQRAVADLGIAEPFVQENHTFSRLRGTVRGLHFQTEPHPASKLVRVTRGAILDVAVDIRQGSPTFGQHVSVTLSSENWHQLYVPTGFAHGFCTLEDNSEVVYKTSAYWDPDCDRGLLWNDSDLAVDWPVDPSDAVLSSKDRSQPRLHELGVHFRYLSAG